jgi:hypothetical protein
MLGLQLLAHGESHRGLVQGLIGRDGHLNLITDSQQEKAALGLVEGNLADDLIEALGEELLTNGANA